MTELAIGFIGLGNMGHGMAINILAKSNKLSVFDKNEHAIRILEKAGATAATNPSHMTQLCDVIVLCLPSAEIVEQVLFGENSITSSITPTAPKPIILDASTLLQSNAFNFAQKLAELGIDYCDCPVSGLPARAINGTLTVMFGGSRSNFDKIEHILQRFSSTVLHCGDVGSGQAMKAVNNTIYNINIAALSEVLPVALANGLNPEALSNIVCSGSARSFAAEHFVPKIMRDNFEGDYSLSNAYKDVKNIQQMAKSLNTEIPLSDAMTQYYEAAMTEGYEQQSKSAMIKLKEQELNVALRTKPI